MQKKIRLDQYLVESGLAESREKAKRLILAGLVLCGTDTLSKPGLIINLDKQTITLKEKEKYVSRGGLKIEGFFKTINLSVSGFDCIDIGSSTGGFTDFLLQNGAISVTCVDVGSNILHWKLQNDPRIKIFENLNARYITKETINCEFDLAVIDVSFISLKLIIPKVKDLIKVNGSIIALIKPQFEAGQKNIEKGGVVRSVEIQKQCVDNIISFSLNEGLIYKTHEHCCIKGPAGNQEYFVWFTK